MEFKRLGLTSAVPSDFTLEALRQVIPSAFTEVRGEDGQLTHKVDFERLRELLGDAIADADEERYGFYWVGKQEAKRAAAQPTRQTLRPVEEESVAWESTQNLYIEGDNLEVLKLLQTAYIGKVKMIYIDPPYNTGNDFVYNDDFAMSREEQDEAMGNLDEEGNRLRRNLDSNPRYHSDWCSMIYSRLLVTRTLLSGDGVIFISIDDNEVHNLRKICDEVFGASNFVNNIVCVSNAGGDKGNYIETTKQYILVYAKNISNLQDKFGVYQTENIDTYSLSDEIGRYKKGSQLEKWGNDATIYTHPNLGYSIYYNESNGDIIIKHDYNHKELLANRQIEMIYEQPDAELIANGYICIRPRVNNDGNPGRWRIEKKTFEDRLASNSFIFERQSNNTIKIYEKNRYKQDKFIQAKDIFPSDIAGQSKDTFKLFNNTNVFSYEKPIRLLTYILSIVNTQDSLILDFFSGSATTAHAVMKLNAEDGGKRKYIMVQIPEKTPEGSEARKAGYDTICEIGKERIRRAGRQIKEELGLLGDDLDIGFRVLRLDSSNMKEVYFEPGKVSQASLFSQVDSVEEGRTPLDLVFGCMVDWGVELSLPIRREEVAGKELFVVNDGALVACFEEEIPLETIRYIAGLSPQRLIFRESSFATDANKLNVYEQFKQLCSWSEEESYRNIRVI